MTNLILKRQLQKNKKKGFTLIELIVVIVIIAIIAAIAVPALTRYINNANVRAAQAQAHNIQVVLQAEVTEYYDSPIVLTRLSGDLPLFTTPYGIKTPPTGNISIILADSGVNIASGSLTNVFFTAGRTLEQFQYLHNGTSVLYFKGKYATFAPGETVAPPSDWVGWQ